MKFLLQKHQIKIKGLKKMNSNENILNFVLIGAKNSGKTYFLSQISNKLLSANDKTTQYLNVIKDDISKNGQTQATSATWHELEFKYQNNKYGTINFNIDDYDGNLTETMSKGNNKEEKDRLKENVKEAEGCIFFIPFEKEIERLKNFADEIDAFINAAQFDNKSKSPIPACIVITKWDECSSFKANDELTIAKQYISDNKSLKVIYEKVEDYFENTKIMVISSKEDYKLLDTIDFCLEKTFYQWYEKAKKLEQKREYEKLWRYLNPRLNNIKGNKFHDFRTIYDKAEKEFILILKAKISNLKTLKEKKELYTEYSDKRFLLDESNQLIEDLKSEIIEIENKEKKQKIFKSMVLILISLFLLIFYFIYETNITAEYKYNKIITSYKSGKNYKELKPQINEFNNLNPIKELNIFVFFDFKSAKKEVESIELKLLSIDREQLKKEKELAEEKEVQLIKEEKEAQLIKEEKEAKQKEEQRDRFLDDLKNCLEQSCENTKEGLEKIKEFINQVDLNYKADKEINSIKRKLEQKLDKFKLDNWKKEANDCISSDKCEEEKLKALFGKYSNNIDEETNIINQSLNIKSKYLQLKAQLEDVDISRISIIEEPEFKNFTEVYKKEIKFILENKIELYFKKEIINAIPTDITDEKVVKIWKNKYEKFKDYCNNNFDLNFDSKSIKIEEFENKLKQIEELKQKGLNYIKVTVIGREKNSIDFGCERNYTLRDRSNIIIEGFNTKLSYEHASKCEDEKVVFNDRITLNVKSYNLDLIEENLISFNKVAENYKIQEQISFSIDELLDLNNGKQLKKQLDNEKIELQFKYVGDKNAN